MRILLIFITLITCTLATQAQVSVEAKIDSIQILIGEQTGVTVSVTAKKGAQITFPALKSMQQVTPGVEVIEDMKADTSMLDNNLIRVSKKYIMTSFDENLYYIPPFKVSVNGKDYQSKSLALKVLTVPVDTANLDKFFPPQDVQSNPFDWNEWSQAFWLSVLFVLLCVITYYLWTRLKENKPVIAKVRLVKKMPPHQKALKEIETLKEERMSVSEDQKTYYTKLTDVLRNYIKERFGFNAMEMTSSEIIEHLRQDGDRKMIDELRELFSTADLVKFAKYSTLINENDANLVNAIDFINNTKQDVQPTVERVESTLTEEDKRSMRSRITLKGVIAGLAVIGTLLLLYIIYQIYLLI